MYPGGVAPSLNPKPVQKYGSWDGTTGEPHGAPTQMAALSMMVV